MDVSTIYNNEIGKITIQNFGIFNVSTQPDPHLKTPMDFYYKKWTYPKRAVIFGHDSKCLFEFKNTEKDYEGFEIYKSSYILQHFSACLLPVGNKMIITGGQHDRLTSLGQNKAVELTFYEEGNKLACKKRDLPEMNKNRSCHLSVVIRNHLIVMFGKVNDKIATSFEYLDIND